MLHTRHGVVSVPVKRLVVCGGRIARKGTRKLRATGVCESELSVRLRGLPRVQQAQVKEHDIKTKAVSSYGRGPLATCCVESSTCDY